MHNLAVPIPVNIYSRQRDNRNTLSIRFLCANTAISGGRVSQDQKVSQTPRAFEASGKLFPDLVLTISSLEMIKQILFIAAAFFGESLTKPETKSDLRQFSCGQGAFQSHLPPESWIR